MKLKDKVVLITDGASRLGLEIGSRLKAEGAIIVLNVYPMEADAGQGDLITNADPVSKKDIDAAVRSILAKYGRIDVVVHNNNDVIQVGLEECTDELYDQALDSNVKSAFLYVQAAGTAMKQAQNGTFIFVSSIHDEKPNGAAFAYSIAKGAVKMLSKEMVLDLGPYNVRTNSINVGPLEGDEQRFYSDISPLYEHTKERIPTNKYVTLEDVANAVLFFASDDCPSANGSELRLDGGFLLSYLMRKLSNVPPEESK